MANQPINVAERLRFHADRVEECGHLNAARYMRLAADELEAKPNPDQAIESPMTSNRPWVRFKDMDELRRWYKAQKSDPDQT